MVFLDGLELGIGFGMFGSGGFPCGELRFVGGLGSSGWDLDVWVGFCWLSLGFFVWFRERVGDCADNGLNGFKISQGYLASWKS